MIEEFEIWNMDHKGVPTKPSKQMVETALEALGKYRQMILMSEHVLGKELAFKIASDVDITVIWIEEMAKL